MVYLSCISQPSNLSCISNLSNFATTPGVKYRLALPPAHFEIADAHISDQKNVFHTQLAKLAVWIMYAKHKQICNVIQLDTGYTIFSTGEFHMVYESSVETEF